MRDLLHHTADLAADFLESIPERPVFPSVALDDLRARLGGALPEGPSEAYEVVSSLTAAGSEGTVAIPEWALVQAPVKPDHRSTRGRLDLETVAELTGDPQPAASSAIRVGQLRARERIRDAGSAILDFADELRVRRADPQRAGSLSVRQRVHRDLVGGEHDLGDTGRGEGRLHGGRPDELAHADEPSAKLERAGRLSERGGHDVDEVAVRFLQAEEAVLPGASGRETSVTGRFRLDDRSKKARSII
jgi:hypothetical protein